MTENTPEWLQDLDNKMKNSFVSPRDFKNVIFDSSSYISVGYAHGRYTKEGTTKYLKSKSLIDITKFNSQQIKEIKLDVQQYAVDHKEWIDYVKSL